MFPIYRLYKVRVAQHPNSQMTNNNSFDFAVYTKYRIQFPGIYMSSLWLTYRKERKRRKLNCEMNSISIDGVKYLICLLLNKGKPTEFQIQLSKPSIQHSKFAIFQYSMLIISCNKNYYTKIRR